MKILVTAISGDIGNGILKILHDYDYELYGCDINPIAVGMDLVKVFWQTKYAIEDGYVEELLENCIRYNITHVIPVNEREIEVISKKRDLFYKNNIKLIIQGEYILDICLDKYNTSLFLSNLGLDVPYVFDNYQEAKAFPGRVICKPRKSNGSKDMHVSYGKDLCEEWFNKEYICQEYVESEEEYTVGVFRFGDVINTISFKRQLKNGYSNIVELVNDNCINDIANTIAKKINLLGYINIQLRKQNGKYYIFEINPRISGTVRFRDLLGYTDVIWWLNLVEGINIDKYQCKYNRAIGMRELNEKFILCE